MSDLFNLPRPPASVAFDGQTYEPKRDYVRLSKQLSRVLCCMADGRWRTLPELGVMVPGSQAGLSARLRDLRKPQYGGHTVERQYRNNGTWEYRLLVNRQDKSPDARLIAAAPELLANLQDKSHAR